MSKASLHRHSGLIAGFVCAIGVAYLFVQAGAGAVAQPRQAQQEPFKGVTTDGTIVPGLFPIRASGVSTAPVRVAANAFLASLDAEQRAITTFPVDDPEWRSWNNVHRANRAGVEFRDMSEAQRAAAFELLGASLSAKGLQTSRDIMRLNGYVADLRDNYDEYGDDLYNMVVLGEPSESEPWGWQLEGHHLIINYFILGDQVVMTPTFMGSEPVSASSGQYAGTAVLQVEQDKGLAFMQSLDEQQRASATIQPEKTRNNAQSQARQDNLVIAYEGLRASELSVEQRAAFLDLVGEYVGNMDEGHARVRMAEVESHLEQTYFAWIGDVAPDAVFYYRIQSPVILIEFDHQSPVALEGPRVPGRDHIHTVVRTPNGNDYGMDILRQHYEAHRNDPNHVHSRER